MAGSTYEAFEVLRLGDLVLALLLHDMVAAGAAAGGGVCCVFGGGTVRQRGGVLVGLLHAMCRRAGEPVRVLGWCA